MTVSEKLSTIFDEAESIGFSVTSGKSVFTVDSLETSVADYFGDYHNIDIVDKYFTNFCIEVFAANCDETNIGSIGFLKGTSIESEICMDYDFTALCDEASGELLRMAEAITEKDGSERRNLSSRQEYYVYQQGLY